MALWIAIGAAGVLIVLAGAVLVIGTLLPERHQASASVHLNAPPERVWAVITDYGAIPGWWPDQKSAQRQVGPDGKEVWLAEDRHGQKIPFVTAAADQPRHLVRRMVDDGLPFGGTWSFDLNPAGGGTDLTITEDGFVRVAFFRFMARFIFGYETTMKSFLASLRQHLG